MLPKLRTDAPRERVSHDAAEDTDEIVDSRIDMDAIRARGYELPRFLNSFLMHTDGSFVNGLRFTSTKRRNPVDGTTEIINLNPTWQNVQKLGGGHHQIVPSSAHYGTIGIAA